MPIEPLSVAAYTTVNALGRGVDASLAALRAGRSGLRPCDFPDADLKTWIGRVDGLEDEPPLAGELARYDCRNNRLARLGLYSDGFADAVADARSRYGAARVGVFIGTSTSGTLSTEQAYRSRDAQGRFLEPFDHRRVQDIFAPADFCRALLGLQGPALGVSTACSSSAKTFAVAQRCLQTGLCDAAVVGGVDSLCLTTLYGFHSLQLTSAQPCRPWDRERDGLSLGEAAAFLLLERAAVGDGNRRVRLRGYGESSDAYHMSSARPDGGGARAAMTLALQRAGLPAARIDYVNLHGTATPANDAAEDQGVYTLFGPDVACSSTKGWTGHTLGAAGAVEAVFACLCIEHDLLPISLNTRTPDPALRLSVALTNQQRPVATVLSNSFGFGGTNCSLLFAASSVDGEGDVNGTSQGDGAGHGDGGAGPAAWR